VRATNSSPGSPGRRYSISWRRTTKANVAWRSGGAYASGRSRLR
jgi:hypothetical protein